MIETITVPFDQFDLTGFIEAYRSFYRQWSGVADADASVIVLEKFDNIPMPVLEDRDLFEELLELKWKLFFFLNQLLADDTTLCIDGEYRNSEDFDIGVADGYGYLIEVHDDKISLHPALYDGSSGPFPTLTLQGHCSVMDECMQHFAAQFIRRSR